MCALFRRKKREDDPPPPPPPPPPVAGESSFHESTQTSYITGDHEEDTRRVRLVIESLRKVTEESRGDPSVLLPLMVDRTVETIGAERGLLFLRDDDGTPRLTVARSAAGTDLPFASTTYTRQHVQAVLETGKPRFDSGGDSGDFDPSQSMINLDIRSLMCVALNLEGDQRGALYVDARGGAESPFDRGDLRFFEAFADMLTIVWRNRLAMEERLRAERMSRDLELVRTIQAGLLPDRTLSLAGYTVAGKVIPADEAGGDYYDFFEMAGERMAVAVGDVSGHGPGPALIMAGARAYMRSTCQAESSPGAVLTQLNEHLANDTDDDKFMSMFLGVVEPRTHRFCWSNAGHPASLLVRAGSGDVVECRRTGMALGVIEDGEFGDSDHVELAPGDTVVLYTDGIIELRKVLGSDPESGEPRYSEEQYGTERLLASIREHGTGSADDLVEGIIGDAVAWAGSAHPGQDDLTVAVLRRDS